MHIITSEGKIIEGRQLSAAEVDIIEELTDGGKLNEVCDSYISASGARRIALYLVENFHIVRRLQPAEPAPIDVEYAEVAPPVEFATPEAPAYPVTAGNSQPW